MDTNSTRSWGWVRPSQKLRQDGPHSQPLQPPGGTELAWAAMRVSDAEDGLHRTSPSTTRSFPGRPLGRAGRRYVSEHKEGLSDCTKPKRNFFLKKGKVCRRWEDPRQSSPSRSLTLSLLWKETGFFLSHVGPEDPAAKPARRRAGGQAPGGCLSHPQTRPFVRQPCLVCLGCLPSLIKRHFCFKRFSTKTASDNTEFLETLSSLFCKKLGSASALISFKWFSSLLTSVVKSSLFF